MKLLIKILGLLLILPGFIFDTCIGIAFILNDGRADHHKGDFIGEWAVYQVNHIPEWLEIPFAVSVVAGVLPAGLLCIVIVIGSLFLSVYVLNGIIGSILQLPFTGKIRWVTLTSLTSDD